MTRDEILDLRTNDGETIRNYFISLLETLWKEGEGFSGKRPFGDSGWQYDLYYPLAKAGLIKAEFDQDYLEDFDQEKADKLILELIQSLR
jgi:hypothetical protein